MTKALEKLQAALAAYTGNTGPVEWSVAELSDCDGASLVATYSETLALEDEPWVDFGGDAILAAAGFDRCDGGMDSYQLNGENLVDQWVQVKDAE